MMVIHFNKKKLYGIGAFMMMLLGTLCLWKEEVILTNASISYDTIIIDAGHGKPDGGAVSSNGVEEESLNLAIALKLRNALESQGYQVIMTRETSENIADEEQKISLREMKASDLENRVKIANENKADFMISIHMNQFPKSNSWGWQTFYSRNSIQGKKLAQLIQKKIGKYIARENKRTALPIDGIKIVDQTNLPVIIVECGFLSNPEDLQLLQTEEYQHQLVNGIIEAIDDYYEELENGTILYSEG